MTSEPNSVTRRTRSAPHAIAAEASRFIVGPFFDHFFFIWSPVMFLTIGAAIDASGMAQYKVAVAGRQLVLFPVLAVTLATGHLLAVLFRTHLNSTMRRQYPIRLLVVPPLVFLLMQLSARFLILLAIFLVWLDVWHSSMQTFGLGRLYDMRRGNEARIGRNLDLGLALFVYAGPIVGGASLATHLEKFSWFGRIGIEPLAALPIWTVRHGSELSATVAVAGLTYAGFYAFKMRRYSKLGYKVSVEKILLYLSLTVTSVWTWGFDSFGQAFLIMQGFHALQYYAIIGWSESDNLTRTLRLDRLSGGRVLAMLVVVVSTLSVGFWAAAWADSLVAATLILLVQFCHFWWDGFIWSVQKRATHFPAALACQRT
ncbi:MAG: hypothetical protein HY791_34460 [Deltaproteobacteria bacterium]|nr:hypothetical protein [Deltaproteobacteria bacterium]